jgi:hypothetical protein
MWITPFLPIALRSGGRVTWLKSQWKLRAYPAQFRVEINIRPSYVPGSLHRQLAYAAAVGARQTSFLASNAQAVRAILLASATITSMRGLRASIRASHEPAARSRRLA